MSIIWAPAAENSGATRITAPARIPAEALLESVAVRVGAISALALVPCFWLSRIQAGDLSSHLYNAWLSILIGEGKAAGLAIVPQWTNVLFDLMLSGLMRAVGPWGAEHIAVSLVVLIFVWGAFAMVCAISGRRPWHLLAIIVMLAYGWVFHMGFMNFYLAMGLSFWAFALLWKQTAKSMLCAAPLLVMAGLAHALPVAWAIGAAFYMWAARRMTQSSRLILGGAALALLVALRLYLWAAFPTRWTIAQIFDMTGADQLSVFGGKYYPLAGLLLAVCLSLLFRLTGAAGKDRSALQIPLQICLITSVAVLVLPSAVLLPQYHHALTFISDRLSLVVAVMMCALVARVVPNNLEKAALATVAALFFSFVYADTRALNHLEDLVEASVAKLPPGSRVVSGLCDLRTEVNPVAHLVDRACIGRCFSYANYEPSTAQFRIRPLPGNDLVVSEYADSDDLQNGTYQVKKGDEPLYQVYLHDGSIDLRQLHAGEIAGRTCFPDAAR